MKALVAENLRRAVQEPELEARASARHTASHMMLDQALAVAENHGVPWGTIVLYVVGGVSFVAVTVTAAFRVVWNWMKEKDAELNDARELRATTAEERAKKPKTAKQKPRTNTPG